MDEVTGVNSLLGLARYGDGKKSRETAGPADLEYLRDLRDDVSTEETIDAREWQDEEDDLEQQANDATVGEGELEQVVRCLDRPPESVMKKKPRRARSAYEELLGPLGDGGAACDESSGIVTGLEVASAAAHVPPQQRTPPQQQQQKASEEVSQSALKSCLSSSKRDKKKAEVTFCDESVVATFSEDEPAASTPRAERARRAPVATGPPRREPIADQRTKTNDAAMARWAITVGRPSPPSSISKRRRSGTFAALPAERRLSIDSASSTDSDEDESATQHYTREQQLTPIDEEERESPEHQQQPDVTVQLESSLEALLSAPIEPLGPPSPPPHQEQTSPPPGTDTPSSPSGEVQLSSADLLAERLRAEAERLERDAEAAEATEAAWKSLRSEADSLESAAERLAETAIAERQNRKRIGGDKSQSQVPTDVILSGWKARKVDGDEVFLVQDHALFGHFLQVKLLLSKQHRPRLVCLRNPSPQSEFVAKLWKPLAEKCLFESPWTWLYPPASKKKSSAFPINAKGGFEVQLDERDQAPAALERCDYFAAKLAHIAHEVYSVETRCESSLQVDKDAMRLSANIVSHTKIAQITLSFVVRPGYPDPASRTTTTSRRSVDAPLLALAVTPDVGGSDAVDLARHVVQTLTERGLLLPQDYLPNRQSRGESRTVPAAMPVPGALIAIVECALEAAA